MALEFQALPPKDAIDFFRNKGYAISFNWQDIWQEEHARAFTVAKALRYDVLEDIRAAVDSALANGTTLQQFKKDLVPKLKAKGWWGSAPLYDSKTDRIIMSQLGSSKRLAIIYDTNLRMARAAGQWVRIEKVKKHRPYLRYTVVIDGRTRLAHKEKHNYIFPVDHPFWDSWFPPNGWNCRCTVIQYSARDLANKDLFVTSESDFKNIVQKPAMNTRTGEIHMLPSGISKGFNYNVGKHHLRGITPPPISGPIKTPTLVTENLPPMPKARKTSADRLVDPKGKTDDQLINGFLSEFSDKKHLAYEDKLGEVILISSDFFFDQKTGRAKMVQTIRKKAIKLLADTIKDPDEIWWSWEYHSQQKKWKMRRRYFARFDIEGSEVPIMIAVEIAPDGWKAVTAFRPAKVSYLEKQRGGTLAYRRDKEKEDHKKGP
jgi:SPP1 gp7 family putative phage head morphogenesis protein